MNLNGEEKRIQALFHELRSEDHLVAPPFARTWNIAQAGFNRAGSSRAVLDAFPKLPRLLTAIVIVAFVLAAAVLWSQQPRPNRQDTMAKQLPTDPGHTVHPPTEGINGSRIGKPGITNGTVTSHRRLRRAGRALAASRVRRIRESGLSRWQSPTVGLLRFTGDELLKNNPALNQSTHEMRGFLSNLN